MSITPQYTSFKIFSDNQGQKVLDFSCIEYKKDKLDPNGNIIPLKDSTGNIVYKANGETEAEKELKGWRLKIEGTIDGWKNKKTIYLQDGEVSNLIWVLFHQRKEMKCQRPDKTLTVEDQGEHSYLTLSAKDKEVKSYFTGKITQYDAIKLISISLVVIHQEIKRELGVSIGLNEILSTIKSTSKPTVISNVVPITEGPNPIVSTGIVSPTIPGGCACSKCGSDLSNEKSKPVVEYSIKKWGSPVCYNCQKLIK